MLPSIFMYNSLDKSVVVLIQITSGNLNVFKITVAFINGVSVLLFGM